MNIVPLNLKIPHRASALLRFPKIFFPGILFTGIFFTGVLFTRTIAIGGETRLELRNVQDSIQNQELTSGPVKVVVNYEPIVMGSDRLENNLQLQLFYNNQPYRSVAHTTYYWGEVELLDLDNNNSPEVIVKAFSGGAHCCTTTTTYSWTGTDLKSVSFTLDGYGGSFQDLNQDGQVEFVTIDNAFLYAFSSYAGSFPPSLILNFKNGQYQDTTTQFPDHLKSHAWKMYQTFQERENNSIDRNGLLAGYVAQKIRLGEYESGLAFMLTHYNSEDDWGLNRYDQAGNVIGSYANFPAALEQFLKDLGYLDPQGRPQASIDRTPVDGRIF